MRVKGDAKARAAHGRQVGAAVAPSARTEALAVTDAPKARAKASQSAAPKARTKVQAVTDAPKACTRTPKPQAPNRGAKTPLKASDLGNAITWFPLEYRSHPAGRRFHREAEHKRCVIAVAGRRGGKTQAGAAEFVVRVVNDVERKVVRGDIWRPGSGKEPTPFVRYLVVAPTYALLNQPKMALQRYFGMRQDGGLILSQLPAVWWLIGGIRIDFGSGDRPERLVSHGYHGVWLDEAARLKPAVWAENLRATLSDTLGWALFTSTPLGRNWLWREVWAKGDPTAAAEVAKLTDTRPEDVLDPSYAGVTWTTAQNTALPHLAAEMEQARRELPPEQFARNYLASFEVFAGQIFKLDAARHLDAAPPHQSDIKRLFAGIDLGTTHPTVVSLWAERADGTFHELETIGAPDVLFDDADDWRQRDTSGSLWTSQVYRLFRRYTHAWRSVPLRFPADRPDVRRQFELRGFQCLSAFQEHEAAISWFQTGFHCNRLKIRTQALWTQLLSLRRPEPGQRSTKAWVDHDDDFWDGARYALSGVIEAGDAPTGRSLTAMGWTARRT